MKAIDLTGMRFDRLLAIRRIENFPGYKQAAWLFLCDCGKEVKALGYNVYHGRQKSCGCFNRENPSRVKHGMAGSPEHRCWVAMRARCNNPGDKAFKHYGGRGIKVCERWNDFQNFLDDMGPRPEGTSIDRKNNDGDYEPGNCWWSNDSNQVRNRRVSIICEYEGARFPLAELAEKLGMPYKRLYHRYVVEGKRGHELTKPPRSIHPGKNGRGI